MRSTVLPGAPALRIYKKGSFGCCFSSDEIIGKVMNFKSSPLKMAVFIF